MSPVSAAIDLPNTGILFFQNEDKIIDFVFYLMPSLLMPEDEETIDKCSTVEAAQCTGFSTRQLGYWAKQGLVTPCQTARGRGSSRKYALDDLVQLHFIRRLKQKRWSTQKVREAMVTLRAVMNDPNPLKNAIIIEEPGVFIALFKTEQGRQGLVEALNAGGQQVLEIVLETLTEETRLELAQLK